VIGAEVTVPTATVTANGLINESPCTHVLDPVALVPTVNALLASVPTLTAVILLNSVVVLTVVLLGPVSVVVRSTLLVSYPVIEKVDVLILPVLVTLIAR
jgi:hypothetical protein